MNTDTVSVRLARATKARLQQLAESTGRSRAFLAAEAIEEYLDINEWQVAGILGAMASLDRTEGRSGVWGWRIIMGEKTDDIVDGKNSYPVDLNIRNTRYEICGDGLCGTHGDVDNSQKSSDPKLKLIVCAKEGEQNCATKPGKCECKVFSRKTKAVRDKIIEKIKDPKDAERTKTALEVFTEADKIGAEVRESPDLEYKCFCIKVRK
jgi:RHH-type transcriptional regulator, rel operon repressor / antitoxin RelB